MDLFRKPTSPEFTAQVDELEARLARADAQHRDRSEVFLNWFYNDANTQQVTCRLASNPEDNGRQSLELTLTCPRTGLERTIAFTSDEAKLPQQGAYQHLHILARLTVLTEMDAATFDQVMSDRALARSQRRILDPANIEGLMPKAGADHIPHVELTYFYLNQLYSHLDDDVKRDHIRRDMTRLLQDAGEAAPSLAHRLAMLARGESANPNVTLFSRATAQAHAEACRFELSVHGQGQESNTISVRYGMSQTTPTEETEEAEGKQDDADASNSETSNTEVCSQEVSPATKSQMLWDIFLDTGDLNIIDLLKQKAPEELLRHSLEYHNQTVLRGGSTETSERCRVDVDKQPVEVRYQDKDGNYRALIYLFPETEGERTPVCNLEYDEGDGQFGQIFRSVDDEKLRLQLLAGRVLLGEEPPEDLADSLKTWANKFYPNTSHMTSKSGRDHAIDSVKKTLWGCVERAYHAQRLDLTDHVLEVARGFSGDDTSLADLSQHRGDKHSSKDNVILARGRLWLIGEDEPYCLGDHAEGNEENPVTHAHSFVARLHRMPLTIVSGDESGIDQVSLNELEGLFPASSEETPSALDKLLRDPHNHASPEFRQNYARTICHAITALAQEPSATDAAAESRLSQLASHLINHHSIHEITHMEDGVRITFDVGPHSQLQETLPNSPEVSELLQQHTENSSAADDSPGFWSSLFGGK